MVRVKGGIISQKRKRNILRQTKGFRWGRKNKLRAAKEALMHALKFSYRDRKVKKSDFRRFWQTRINAASRQLGLPYGKFMNSLKKNKIELDRKVLSEISQKHPQIFEKLVEAARK
ncbi:MAG: 50S ribosomal protein L20 [Candidatus Pacebacteria bacterium]|nr:50S ribosomal protein L20 [Candidatus Paceibacterota bacterium]